MIKPYEESGLYRFGVALTELGEMFTSGQASVRDLTAAAHCLGIKMEFRISPDSEGGVVDEMPEMPEEGPQGEA